MRDTSTGFLGNSAIVLDSSSILLISETQENSDLFWASLIEKAEASKAQIVVPSGVVREIDRHQNRVETKEALKGASKRALKTLLDLSNRGSIAIVDDHMNTNCDEREIHADPYFINFVNMFKMRKNIYIITQDVNLMQDVWATLNMSSINGKIRGENGDQVQKIVPKKVFVLKVARKKDGDTWIVMPALLKPFKPDPTVALIAKALGVPVDDCLNILNKGKERDVFEASSTLSKHYESVLRHKLSLEKGHVSKITDAGSPVPHMTKPEKSGLPAFKPFES